MEAQFFPVRESYSVRTITVVVFSVSYTSTVYDCLTFNDAIIHDGT